MSGGDVTIGFLNRFPELLAGQEKFAVDITGGTISNVDLLNIDSITLDAPLAVSSGGTGGATETAARESLGLEIGVDVQAYSAGLASIAGLTTAADKGIYTTASNTYAVFDLTAAGRALLDDVDAAAQRTTLGLGTIATQAANNVAITGGTITDVTLAGTTLAAASNVKVSANDTTPGDLETKLLVGTGLALSTQNDGGNETRTIAHDFASQVEAEAGTATDKPMNALRTAQAIAALAGGGLTNGGFATNRYYYGLGYVPASGSSVQAANRLYFKPFVVTEETTFTRVGFEVTTGAAGNARIGIYNFVNGIPTSLITDFGTVDTGTTGNKEVTISETLSPGIYAIATVFNATPDVRELTKTNSITDWYVGLTNTTDTTTAGGYGSHTYGGLPSTFPSIASYETTDRSGTWMRVV